MDKQFVMEEAEKVLMHTYGRYPVVLDHGDGVNLYETDGTKYLDFAAGIAVFALGYNNKEYNDSLKAQVDKLLHTSNYYYNEPAYLAAKGLVEASGMDRVFFTNSGTEAIEGAIKLARKYYYKKTGSNDSQIIAMNHSFHGRSMGALSVTGTKKYREPFEPLIGGAVFAEYNDFDSVLALVNEKTAAIIMETVQGEGGIYPANADFIKKVRALCDEKDIVMILDEIQCGMGRSGTMFAYQQYGVMPDVMTTAKALGCGVPVGAFAAREPFASALEPGDHGTTYGGNPFACNAVATVFDLFKKLDICENAKKQGAYLYEKLEELAAKYPNVIKAHRGLGLMQGIELNIPAGPVIKEVMKKGVILIGAGANIIRFVPPLVITEKDTDECMNVLSEVLSEI